MSEYIFNKSFYRAWTSWFLSRKSKTEVSVHVQHSIYTVMPDLLCMCYAEYLLICDKLDVSRTHCTYCMYKGCLQTTGAACPSHVRLIVRELTLHVVMQRSTRFHACIWSLSFMYFPSIYIFYMYDSYLRNVLVSNTWQCHGKKQSTAADFVVNSGNRMKLRSANEGTLWDPFVVFAGDC